MAKITFITSTDTGVGKTVLTTLLLTHLRQSGCQAGAMKPFCCGERSDAEILARMQNDQVSIDEINPFYFPEPLAPLVAARIHRKTVLKSTVLTRIREFAKRFDRVLIEGAGGLLAPLGPRFSLLTLILELKGEVIVVAPNRLGTINHTILTGFGLQVACIKRFKIVMMDQKRPDLSARSNPGLIAELFDSPVFRLPFLGPGIVRPGTVRKSAHQLKKTLVLIAG